MRSPDHTHLIEWFSLLSGTALAERFSVRAYRFYRYHAAETSAASLREHTVMNRIRHARQLRRLAGAQG